MHEPLCLPLGGSSRDLLVARTGPMESYEYVSMVGASLQVEMCREKRVRFSGCSGCKPLTFASTDSATCALKFHKSNNTSQCEYVECER